MQNKISSPSSTPNSKLNKIYSNDVLLLLTTISNFSIHKTIAQYNTVYTMSILKEHTHMHNNIHTAVQHKIITLAHILHHHVAIITIIILIPSSFWLSSSVSSTFSACHCRMRSTALGYQIIDMLDSPLEACDL